MTVYRGAFSEAEYEDVRAFYRDTEPTPLHAIGNVLVKDEGQRTTLGAFKVVGVAYALDRLLRDGRIPRDAALVCASAGNHGRAVARVGRERGFDVRVYMSASASVPAQERIRAEGADVVLVDGTYDDAVERTKTDGGFIVSDTAWDGYEEVPRLIMAGYTHIVDEAASQWSTRPDRVFIQAGVGSFASAVVSWLCHRYGAERPHIVCVRPASAGSIMAGLDCERLSTLAMPILREGCDGFVAIDDDEARDAMRRLGDAGISAGPSGAAGYAAYLASGQSGNVLVFNTEKRFAP